MTAIDIVVMALVGIGTFFVLVAAIGVLRLSDVLMRMHASSKASTLGAVCTMTGVGIHFLDPESIWQVVMICVFLLGTAPVAAHAIARAAYRRGVKLCDKTHLDELAEARRAEEDATS